MCFYNEYDWSAEVVEYTGGPATSQHRCFECHTFIHPGEWVHKTFMQEHEDCQHENRIDDNEDVTDFYESGIMPHWCNGLDAEPCVFGETHQSYVCQSCTDFRAAIRAVEEADGCVGDEAEPQNLFDDIAESDHYHQYFDHAANTFPHLVTSGYIDKHYYFDDDEWEQDDLAPIPYDELGVSCAG